MLKKRKNGMLVAKKKVQRHPSTPALTGDLCSVFFRLDIRSGPVGDPSTPASLICTRSGQTFPGPHPNPSDLQISEHHCC